MKNRVLFGIAAWAALGAANGVAAQAVVPADGNEPAEPATAAAEAQDALLEAIQPAVAACEASAPSSYTLPRMTPVAIRIDANVDSKENATGDTFPVSLAEPVMVNGVVVLPAGIEGQGEVIHAKKSGMSGSAGELIITANFLDFGGERIALRSMKMAKTGKSNIGLAGAIGAAPYIGPVGFFLSGKNITVSEGTVAGANLAQDVTVRMIEDGGAAPGVCNTGEQQ